MAGKRVGFAPRLGVIALDGVLSGVAALVALVIAATTGGIGLGLKYQEMTGGRVTVSTLIDGTFGRQLRDRSDELARNMDRLLTERFTAEQRGRMRLIIETELKRSYLPLERNSSGWWVAARRLARVNESTLGELIDRVYSSVKAASIQGVKTGDLDAMRAELRSYVDDTGLGRFLPAVVRYAAGLVAIPLAVDLLYSLVELIVGASVGKLLLGFRIGTAGGRRADAGTLIVRFLAKYSGSLLAIVAVLARAPELLPISALLYALFVAGCFATLGPERRALHDYVAGSAVYRADELDEGPERA